MKRRAELWRRDPRPGALVILAGVAGLAFAGLVLAVLVSPAFVAFDEAASAAFRSADNTALDAFFGGVTVLGDLLTALGLTVVAYLVLWLTGRRPEAVLLALTVVLGTGAGYLAKEVIERARPGIEYARIILPDSYSFPSGHALSTFLLFGMIAFIVVIEARTVRTRVVTVSVCGAAAVLVAISRVYLGVHWFGDILASWVLGMGIIALAVAVYAAATTGVTGDRDEPSWSPHDAE